VDQWPRGPATARRKEGPIARAVAAVLRDPAAEIGARIGVPFGETFRYERFDPLIEALLAARAGA
jgi:hypothetical protein